MKKFEVEVPVYVVLSINADSEEAAKDIGLEVAQDIRDGTYALGLMVHSDSPIEGYSLVALEVGNDDEPDVFPAPA